MPDKEWPRVRDECREELDELARIDEYWAWLATVEPVDNAWRCLDLPEGRNVVELQSAQDADFEAAHLHHSIGFNWDKYAGLGRVLSLRDGRNTPQITMLVVDGCIVHARGYANRVITEPEYEAILLIAEKLEVALYPHAQL